jgi:hypothetical protein
MQTPKRGIKSVHQLKPGRKDLTMQHIGGGSSLDDSDTEILSVLRRSLFSWVRTIADSLGILASTGYLPLVEKIGFKNYLLYRVPHILTPEPRRKRVELAGELLALFKRQ